MKGFLTVARRLLELVMGGFLVLLMLLTFIDVVGRYFFGQPLPGGHVLAQCLVCLVVFTGLPVVALDDEHLRVRLLDGYMTARRKRVRDFVFKSIVIAALAVLAGQMFWQAGYFSVNGEYFESIRIPLSWMAGYAAAMTSLAALLAIAGLLHSARRQEGG
ncbi:MAG: TRAP transporter small permease [Gammaproteobacteria bacterium]|nr:TRAP transporter small permease [Gammaproteobacteria bacterium]MCY4340509.1 TRAP transporter small permease [Gammaproteobacteria bacterium]